MMRIMATGSSSMVHLPANGAGVHKLQKHALYACIRQPRHKVRPAPWPTASQTFGRSAVAAARRAATLHAILVKVRHFFPGDLHGCRDNRAADLRHSDVTKGLQRSARSWLMTEAGPMPMEWTGPHALGRTVLAKQHRHQRRDSACRRCTGRPHTSRRRAFHKSWSVEL